jgi:hypothetical protein
MATLTYTAFRSSRSSVAVFPSTRLAFKDEIMLPEGRSDSINTGSAASRCVRLWWGQHSSWDFVWMARGCHATPRSRHTHSVFTLVGIQRLSVNRAAGCENMQSSHLCTVLVALPTLPHSLSLPPKHSWSFSSSMNTLISISFNVLYIKNTVDACCKDIGLCDASFITSDILWFQLIPHC